MMIIVYANEKNGDDINYIVVSRYMVTGVAF